MDWGTDVRTGLECNRYPHPNRWSDAATAAIFDQGWREQSRLERKKLNKDRKSSFLFLYIWILFIGHFFSFLFNLISVEAFNDLSDPICCSRKFFSSESQQLKRKFASEEFSVFDQKDIFRQFFAWNYLLHEPEYFSKLWKHLLNFFMFRGL